MITVSMPTYLTPGDLLLKAVRSILDQTYRDITLVVVSDGGGRNAFRPLAHIDDPRLVRFEIDPNRGRYYVDAVTLAACQTEWWSPHDSDDWSDPERFELLLHAAELSQAQAAYCDAVYHLTDGTEKPSPVRPKQKHGKMDWRIAKYPAGIYRTEIARAIGGPHPELRGSYDTAFTSLLWDLTTPAVVHQPLYHIQKRPGSLTTATDTGHGGQWRKDQQRRRRALYYEALRHPPAQWPAVLAPSDDVRDAVAKDVLRLSDLLGLQGGA